MATGRIVDYDPKKRKGYIESDDEADDEDIPFEISRDNEASFSEGDHVQYDVEGGLAGIMAIDVRKV